ncbi:MAG: sugar kinase [Acidimicrobiaceae bacterium]|nr:sugar kinase [Acidimicrobiaceae bacterium]
MPGSRVICLDTVMVDVVFDVAQLPTRGGDALSSRRVMTTGGGFNLMSAARRQGMSVAYLGQIGSGPLAELAQRSLDEEGIVNLAPSRGPLDIGLCVVLVDDGAERTFVTSPGAELTLSRADLDAVEWLDGDVVYLSGYDFVYPELAEVVTPWLATLDERVTVSFDPGPRVSDISNETLRVVLERTDWLLSNEVEAECLSHVNDPEEALVVLQQRWNCEGLVIRLGERGCVGARANEYYRAGGFRVPAVDTNGAGDVHNGVVLASLSEGVGLATALLRANAAAAHSVATFGPATGPTRTQVDAFLANHSLEVQTTAFDPGG